MRKKYEFTDEIIFINGKILHRIKALIDIDQFDVKAGDLGGFIEVENNLSHDDYAWVSENAVVSENAWIRANAWIRGNAVVSENAVVTGDAVIYGDTERANSVASLKASPERRLKNCNIEPAV